MEDVITEKNPMRNALLSLASRERRVGPRWSVSAVLLALALPSMVLAVPLSTELVASGLDRPLYVTAPEGDQRLFIIEQRGVIRILKHGAVLATPFLDIDNLVADIVRPRDERGLLGLAFHPNYATNGLFYVNYYSVDNETVVARYSVSGNPDVADPASALTVLTIAQPEGNHNGGHIAFGPGDGYLYIGMGDGGGAGDPLNNGQSDDTLLGKMLRIDVDGGTPYAVPPDNPFVGPGPPLDEIWAKGLRNPYRFAFDRSNGDLYVGDVGQDVWEEIDVQPAASTGGENYGWRLTEGNHCYNPPSDCDPGNVLDYPIHEYQHGGGRCSVTGGYVYRGRAIADLQGTYFFADFCTGDIWSFRVVGGQVTEFTNRAAELAPGGGLAITSIAGFGEDGFGELYIVDLADGPDGEVYKIVPEGVANEPPTCDGGGPYSGDVGEPVQFDGTASTDPDGVIAAYAWDFGDGSNGTGPTPEHTYTMQASFTVDLCVTDNDNNESCCQTTVNVTSAVELAWFELVPDGDQVAISWRTSFEENHLGFHLLRAEVGGDDRFAQLTAEMIPAGTAGRGNDYRFEDRVVEPGRTYAYRLRALDRLGGSEDFDLGTVTVGRALPPALILHPGSPNPFNPRTRIRFELDTAERVALRIYASTGHLVRTLVDADLQPDVHVVEWDGLDDRGRPVASGVYIYRLEAGERSLAKRLVLVR